MRVARSFGFLVVLVVTFAVGIEVGTQARALVADLHFWISLLVVVGFLGLCATLGVLFSDH